MANYMITYLGGNPPSTPEDGKQHFARYMEWLGTLGDAVVSPANPIKGTMTVHPDGQVSEGGSTAMSGFTVIQAGALDEALALAKGCPFLDIGGSLEVSEMMQMPGQKSE